MIQPYPPDVISDVFDVAARAYSGQRATVTLMRLSDGDLTVAYAQGPTSINPAHAKALRRVEAVVAEAIFHRITDLSRRGNTHLVHVSDLLEIMAEHGVTE